MPTVLLLGTLDTKGVEYAFLRDQLLEHGVDVLIVDAGIHEPVGLVPDVARGEVAHAGGTDIGSLASAGDRGAAVTAMGAGAESVVRRLHAEGKLDETLYRVISDNIRFPESSLGDMKSQMAACRLAARRLDELFRKYGRDMILDGIGRITEPSWSR